VSRSEPVWIAIRKVTLVHPDGRRVEGRIAIGRPYVLGAGDVGDMYESHCPIEITELLPGSLPMIGGGTFDALINALRTVAALLRAFLEQGGRVLDPEGDSDLDVDGLLRVG